jgi:hypothetical protein
MHRRALTRQPVAEQEAVERIEDQALGATRRTGHGEHVAWPEAAIAQPGARRRPRMDAQGARHRQQPSATSLTA